MRMETLGQIGKLLWDFFSGLWSAGNIPAELGEFETDLSIIRKNCWKNKKNSCISYVAETSAFPIPHWVFSKLHRNIYFTKLEALTLYIYIHIHYIYKYACTHHLNSSFAKVVAEAHPSIGWFYERGFWQEIRIGTNTNLSQNNHITWFLTDNFTLRFDKN